MRPAALRATVLLASLCMASLGLPGAARADEAPALARRVISMNPSLTAMLMAVGAADRLVGVDEFSARQLAAVAALPRVGGLYNPSLEAVAALRPDLVVLVPSFEQRGFRTRLEELGIPVLAFDPVGFEEVLETIEVLGERVGRGEAARGRADAIRRTRQVVRERVGERPRLGSVLVLQRDPLFVAGRGSFLDEMLADAGARNLAARFADPYPRVSEEWLVAAAPDVILDAAPGAERADAFWSRWPSLPAVSAGRVVAVPADPATLPGPWLDRALLTLARALHGPLLFADLEPGS